MVSRTSDTDLLDGRQVIVSSGWPMLRGGPSSAPVNGEGHSVGRNGLYAGHRLRMLSVVIVVTTH